MVIIKSEIIKIDEETVKTLNKMSAVYVYKENIDNDQDLSACIIVRHDKYTKEVLRSEFENITFNNNIIMGVPLFDLLMLMENLNYYTDGGKIDYMGLNFLTTLYTRHKVTGKSFISLSLQNKNTMFIDYLILIPVKDIKIKDYIQFQN